MPISMQAWFIFAAKAPPAPAKAVVRITAEIKRRRQRSISPLCQPQTAVASAAPQFIFLIRRPRVQTHNHLWTPLWTQGIFSEPTARSWVLTSVRPRMRPHRRRRPIWKFADQLQIRSACLEHLVMNWLTDPVSPTDAPYFPFDHPTSSTTSQRTTAYAAAGA